MTVQGFEDFEWVIGSGGTTNPLVQSFVNALSEFQQGLPVETAARIAADAAEAETRATADALLMPLTRLTGAAINVRDAVYGATGDGVTDDLAALQAANTAAAAAGKALYIPQGTYVISARWTPTVSILAEPGATIKKKSTMTDFAMVCATPNVTWENFTLDGNRAAGATSGGIAWTLAGATNGVLRNVTVKNTKGDGIGAYTSADLRTYSCESSGNVSGNGLTAGTGNGFKCDTGAKLRQFDCVANDNDGDGVAILNGSADGCLVDCRVNRNLRFGGNFRANNGTIKHLSGEYNNRFGAVFGVSNAAVYPTGWHCEYMDMRHSGGAFTNLDGGAVPENGSGSSYTFYGMSRCTFGVLVSRAPRGYAAALTKESVGSVGCINNKFGIVVCDQNGSPDLDPAFHISGDSSGNTVDALHVYGHSFGVSIGEDVVGTPTDNTIGTMYAHGLSYAVVRVDKGQFNTVGKIVARDCYNTDVAQWPALLTFKGATSTDNKVGDFSHRTVSNPAPNAIFSETTSATRNGIVRRDYGGIHDWVPSGGSVQGFSQTYQRNQGVANLATAPTSGTLYLAGGLMVPGGKTARVAVMLSGSTALAAGTHLWALLVRVSDSMVLAATADDTAPVWGATSFRTFTWATPWTADFDTQVWVAYCAVATTMPTLTGLDYNAISSTFRALTPVIAGSADMGLTAPLAVGATVGAVTNHRNHPYAYLG